METSVPPIETINFSSLSHQEAMEIIDQYCDECRKNPEFTHVEYHLVALPTETIHDVFSDEEVDYTWAALDLCEACYGRYTEWLAHVLPVCWKVKIERVFPIEQRDPIVQDEFKWAKLYHNVEREAEKL